MLFLIWMGLCGEFWILGILGLGSDLGVFEGLEGKMKRKRGGGMKVSLFLVSKAESLEWWLV